MDLILNDEAITGVVRKEEFADDILQVLVDLRNEKFAFIDVTVEIHLQAMYNEIFEATTSANLVRNCGMESEAMVNTKYKTMAKKVKLVATQLPPDTNDYVQ